MTTIKDTKELQKEIQGITNTLIELRDSAVETEIEKLFIDMEKILDVFKRT